MSDDRLQRFREELLTTVHAIQTDITILSEILARNEWPVLNQMAVWNLAYLQASLRQNMPSLRRH